MGFFNLFTYKTISIQGFSYMEGASKEKSRMKIQKHILYFAVHTAHFLAQSFEGKISMCIIHG